MFKKTPIALLLLIVIVSLTAPWLPVPLQQLLYGLSLSLKSLITFCLPFVIFGLLFKTTVEFSKYNSAWIAGVILAVCSSNIISTLFGYLIGSATYHWGLSVSPVSGAQSLAPLGQISFPQWIDNSYALTGGILLGLVCRSINPHWAERAALATERMSGLFLKVILFTMPGLITGFIIKIWHNGDLQNLNIDYLLIFLLAMFSVFGYITLCYLCLYRFHLRSTWKALKHTLPAAFVGFRSMSSITAMPLSIHAADKNAGTASSIAKTAVPITVNTHLVGDCFAIPILAFAVLHCSGIPAPTFATYLTFTAYFILTKFSVAAVPAGGILIMLPVIENYLGLSGEMLALTAGLYILFDPLITAANILGNGGLVVVIGRWLMRIQTHLNVSHKK